MIILGIDPGYDKCGFAVLEITQGKENLLQAGIIKTNSSSTADVPREIFANRLKEIATDFQNIIKKYQPEILSIEDLFFAKNVTTALKVSQVRGVLIFLANSAGLKIYEPKPVEVKKVLTGNGRANKKEMQKMMKLIFPQYQHKIDDSVDAIAAALFAKNLHGMPWHVAMTCSP